MMLRVGYKRVYKNRNSNASTSAFGLANFSADGSIVVQSLCRMKLLLLSSTLGVHLEAGRKKSYRIRNWQVERRKKYGSRRRKKIGKHEGN